MQTTSAGQPFSKDPAVVKFKGKYWLYYSIPPYEGKPTIGWTIGVATSDNLVDWTKAGELRNTGRQRRRDSQHRAQSCSRVRSICFIKPMAMANKDAICHAWSDDGFALHSESNQPDLSPEGRLDRRPRDRCGRHSRTKTSFCCTGRHAIRR